MKREDLSDLMTFLAVAEARSFTKAAVRLGTSQSAVSQVVRRLEDRLGVRLLTRTTRNVAPTEAGRRLAERLRPALDEIEAELETLDQIRSTPSGLLRITATYDSAHDLLEPVVSQLMQDFPDIAVEISVDARLVDIAKDGFDAGVRLGEQVDADMIAVPIGPDLSMRVAGAPAYFDRAGRPQTPHELTDHDCINLRLQTLGGLYAWEFEKDGRPLSVRVEGRYTSDDPALNIKMALKGGGLVCLPDQLLTGHLETGALETVLEDWCPPFPGYHLYYPSRRQMTPAFRLLLDRLKAQRQALMRG
ncbi:MAG: LysR family transcriptional regulator [Oceanicaulis sp.]|jgi:DNA-binding transcriptional LysR family regulator|uniref:LysR family transcriptional regulator n=2 Tax=unclassified Oceanicaulis TaxID=2632123 RepID=UPI000C3DAEDC|nr:LysR family transcriptional regulator [Oceanicaulis sp.]MBC39319.1 LysR family transcriptional regulator [Oceanicaulis sp.]MBG35196.1 LysR family transcriptional regulator [Oceanicaulis sp.]